MRARPGQTHQTIGDAGRSRPASIGPWRRRHRGLPARPDRPACHAGPQQADHGRASLPYLGALPDRERVVAAMNFDNLVAVLAVPVAAPLGRAAVSRPPAPGPVLEIVAGIVLGPAVLDLGHPDGAGRMVSPMGLASLLSLAGWEIEVRHFSGPRARLTGLALGLSVVLALIIG